MTYLNIILLKCIGAFEDEPEACYFWILFCLVADVAFVIGLFS